MTWFKLSRHYITDRVIIEVWDSGEFIASIYAGDSGSGTFRIVSKHRLAIEHDQRPPNAVNIRIDT